MGTPASSSLSTSARCDPAPEGSAPIKPRRGPSGGPVNTPDHASVSAPAEPGSGFPGGAQFAPPAMSHAHCFTSPCDTKKISPLHCATCAAGLVHIVMTLWFMG